jgi:DNA-binding XRE family transcriptional regulator
MHSRLVEARKRAGFRSARAAAKFNGWNNSAYGAHENGQNNYNLETAEKYAAAFETRAVWLLTGEGASSEGEDVLMATMKPIIEVIVSTLVDLYDLPIQSPTARRRLPEAIVEFLANHKDLVTGGQTDKLELELLKSLLKVTRGMPE